LRVIGLPFGYTADEVKEAINDNVGADKAKHVSIDYLRGQDNLNLIQLTSCAVFVEYDAKVCPRRIKINGHTATVFDPRDLREEKLTSTTTNNNNNKPASSASTAASTAAPTPADNVRSYASAASKPNSQQKDQQLPSKTPATPLKPVTTTVVSPAVSAPAEIASVSALAESPSSSISASVEMPFVSSPSAAAVANDAAASVANNAAASAATSAAHAATDAAAAPSLVDAEQEDKVLLMEVTTASEPTAATSSTPSVTTKRRPLDDSPSNPDSGPKRLVFDGNLAIDQ
jgi:hypothetical protein